MSDPGGITNGIVQGILDGLGDVIRGALDSWWDQSGPVVFGRLVSAALGAVVTWMWTTVGPLLSSIQVFTRIPPQWTTDLAPLSRFYDRAEPIARAGLLLALLVGFLTGALLMTSGVPFGRLLGSIPVFIACSAGLLLAEPFLRWWIAFANSLSDAMFGTGFGLPGFADMEAIDRLAATGIIGLIWLAFGLWFFVKRIILIGLIVCLYFAAPFILLVGAFPFETCQRIFRWCATTFIAATLVQVLQSGLLVLGGFLVASPVVTGGAVSDAVQDLSSAAIGGGLILCAAWLPGFILGGLGSAAGGSGMGPMLKIAATLASFGGGAFVGRTVVNMVGAAGLGAGVGAGAAYASPPGMGASYGGLAPATGGMTGGYPQAPAQYASIYQVHPGGNVRSLLSGGPPALPAPQPPQLSGGK